MQNGNNTVPPSWALPGEISETARDMQSLVPGSRKEGGNGPEDTGLAQDSRRKSVMLFSWFAGQHGQGSKRGQETRWGQWTYTGRSATPLGAAGRVRPGRRSPGTRATPESCPEPLPGTSLETAAPTWSLPVWASWASSWGGGGKDWGSESRSEGPRTRIKEGASAVSPGSRASSRSFQAPHRSRGKWSRWSRAQGRAERARPWAALMLPLRLAAQDRDSEWQWSSRWPAWVPGQITYPSEARGAHLWSGNNGFTELLAGLSSVIYIFNTAQCTVKAK